MGRLFDAAIWSLLHDAIGDGKDLMLGELVQNTDADALRRLPLVDLRALEPRIKLDVWRRFIDLRRDERLRAERLQQLDLDVLVLGQSNYPSKLLDLYDPPAILYRRGPAPDAGLAIGIVGSRKSTHYGKDMAEKLAFELSRAGVLVISGLARGIDGKAHRGGLQHSAGTVAVLGCGIDVIYPAEHASLTQDILAHPKSSIFSECPLGAQPLPFRFPRRNRIIAAFSEGVLVVEAAQKSGALITARLANEIGRDVFALPGLITSPVSKGPHRLIQDGAKLVMQVDDILEEYGQLPLFEESEKKAQISNLNQEQRAIYETLSAVPRSIESIVEETDLPASTVISHMSLLEIYGLTRELVGRQYIRKQ